VCTNEKPKYTSDEEEEEEEEQTEPISEYEHQRQTRPPVQPPQRSTPALASSSSTSAASSQNRPTPTQRRSVSTAKPGVRFSEQPMSLPSAKSQYNISSSHYTYESPSNLSFSNENLLDGSGKLSKPDSRPQHHQQQPYKNVSLAKSVDHLLASIADSTPTQRHQPAAGAQPRQQPGSDLSRMTGGMSLSKSIKDLKLFVSNSYSPSLIIKPPVNEHHLPARPQVQAREQRVANYENEQFLNGRGTPRHDYQNMVANLEAPHRPGVYKPRAPTHEAQQQTMGRSQLQGNKDNEELLNCILDMKPQGRSNANYDNLVLPSHWSSQARAGGGGAELPRAQQVFSRRQENCKPETARIRTVTLVFVSSASSHFY